MKLQSLTICLLINLSKIDVSSGLLSTSGSNAKRSFATQIGAGGFGASKPSSGKFKVKKSTIKKAQERVARKYGSDIAQATQDLINKAMDDLPPHLQVATQLYQRLQKWDAYFATVSVLDQTRIPEQDMEGARRAREELESIKEEHGLTENDIRNVFQRTTWDASADAKAARALTGKMPEGIRKSLDEACVTVAKSVKDAGSKGRCLDVGCGYGVLVPHMLDAGILPSQIVGMDLSSEMIKNANEQHRGIQFQVADFLADFEDDQGFDSIVFCSALHDLPDPVAALRKAVSLLQPAGTVVILHAQGAAHVLGQVRKNPIMVKRGLPSLEEIEEMNLEGMNVQVKPPRAVDVPYLVVLKKQ